MVANGTARAALGMPERCPKKKFRVRRQIREPAWDVAARADRSALLAA